MTEDDDITQLHIMLLGLCKSSNNEISNLISWVKLTNVSFSDFNKNGIVEFNLYSLELSNPIKVSLDILDTTINYRYKDESLITPIKDTDLLRKVLTIINRILLRYVVKFFNKRG